MLCTSAAAGNSWSSSGSGFREVSKSLFALTIFHDQTQRTPKALYSLTSTDMQSNHDKWTIYPSKGSHTRVRTGYSRNGNKSAQATAYLSGGLLESLTCSTELEDVALQAMTGSISCILIRPRTTSCSPPLLELQLQQDTL